MGDSVVFCPWETVFVLLGLVLRADPKTIGGPVIFRPWEACFVVLRQVRSAGGDSLRFRRVLQFAAAERSTFELPAKPDPSAPFHPEGIIRWEQVFAGLKMID